MNTLIKSISFLLLVSVFSFNVNAKSINDVEFSDTAEAGGKSLSLNGLGLRKVERFGIPIKVYVAGLYLEAKSNNADEIIKSAGPKVLKMVFLRGVDKKDLVKAWKDGMKNNCIAAECDEANKKIDEFNKLMVDSKNKGTMNIQFLPDKVMVEIDGRGKSSGTIDGAVFSRNLLSVFIGPKPPTPEFKNGLLGL